MALIKHQGERHLLKFPFCSAGWPERCSQNAGGIPAGSQVAKPKPGATAVSPVPKSHPPAPWGQSLPYCPPQISTRARLAESSPDVASSGAGAGPQWAEGTVGYSVPGDALAPLTWLEPPRRWRNLALPSGVFQELKAVCIHCRPKSDCF